MTRKSCSSFFLIILVICVPNSAHSENAPSTQSQFSNEEIHQLLHLLGESQRKSETFNASHALLSLGELLLEDDQQQSLSPEPKTTTTTTEKPITIPSTIGTTSTTQPPPIEQNHDLPSSMPSNEELVQQLALFNSLLMSLSTNASSSTPEPQAPQMNEKQLGLLNALFGHIQTTPSSMLMKRQTESSLSAPLGPESTTVAPNIAALSHLISQISNANAEPISTNHLQNFQNSNANLEPSSSNQLSNLFTLLGTLGTLQQQTKQLQQLNFPASATTPTQMPNIFGGLFQPQAQPSQQSSNIFGNLFQPQQQQQQPPQTLGLGGLAPGLSSVFSTMSNIFWGGEGGKPRVRGKGVDTRLGVGYRFGDAADAQIMWDIGPQLFTEPIQNEVRYSLTKKKRQDAQGQQPLPPTSIQSQAQAEKEQQQQLAAARRNFQIQQQPNILNQNRRNFYISPPTRRVDLTPYAQEEAIKELWQLMEMQKRLENEKKREKLSAPLSEAELYEILRDKNIMKRASSISPSPNPTPPTNPPRPYQSSESILKFRKVPVPPPPPPPPFQMQMQMSPSPGFKGHDRYPPHRYPTQQPQHHSFQQSGAGASSQMSRWDMDNADHRFDNFKNTNGELVMMDDKRLDRFSARNSIRRGVADGA